MYICTRDTYTQCRASRSELKVLVCAHDCCNRSMHGTVLRSLDGYIIVFMLSLKHVLWSAREPVKIDWYIKGYKYSKGMVMRLNMMGMNSRG